MATYCARIPMMYELDFPGQFYFYRFFDALTWLIPPFLPIFLNLSSSLALIRLQTANVIGLDGQKIVEAGSVTEMCFDKVTQEIRQEVHLIFSFVMHLDRYSHGCYSQRKRCLQCIEFLTKTHRWEWKLQWTILPRTIMFCDVSQCQTPWRYEWFHRWPSWHSYAWAI